MREEPGLVLLYQSEGRERLELDTKQRNAHFLKDAFVFGGFFFFHADNNVWGEYQSHFRAV